MMKAAKNGPANGLRTKVNEKNLGRMPHSESTKGINTIQENAHAMRK